MQSQSASLPTAPRRSARVVLQPHRSCRRAPGFKTRQSGGLSLTPSRLSVSHSLHPPPPPSNLLHAHTLTPSLHPPFFFFFSCLAFIFALALLPLASPSPLAFAPLFITSLSPRLNFIPSSRSSFFFFFSPWLSPSLSPPSPPSPPHSRSPSVFFTFWQTLVSLY